MELDEHRTPNFKIFEGQQIGRMRTQPRRGAARHARAAQPDISVLTSLSPAILVGSSLVFCCPAAPQEARGMPAKKPAPDYFL